MNKENSDFCWGVFTGVIISTIVGVFIAIMCWVNANKGFENKLVIQYYNPNKEYDREMVRNMVNASGIQTNFTNKTFSMDKYWIEYRMTNPTK